jgi:S1-C subfamily serine protease
MKKLICTIVILLISASSHASLSGIEAHQRYLYPIVRVSTGSGVGSGTIIFSAGEGKASTYVLTNHHVIAPAIRISEEWDSALKKEVKKERRAIVYVEIFKYRDLSTPVGTMKIEADIVIYNESEDMALLKLRYDEPVQYVAMLPKQEDVESYRVMDKSIAVGCSLGFPPLPSVGVITRLGYQIDSLPYGMSSAQIIFGNSGGAMFTRDGILIGIPSRVAVQGWASAVPHMGLFIPVKRIFDWLEREYYDFLFDFTKTEKESLETRENKIKGRVKSE